MLSQYIRNSLSNYGLNETAQWAWAGLRAYAQPSGECSCGTGESRD